METVREVACEEFDQYGCKMTNYTIIRRPDISISDQTDESIIGIDFNNNSNIHFLPISVFRSFPKLTTFGASDCSIREVSKKNFQRLWELVLLKLSGNEIFAITSDTFEDLTELSILLLGEFKYSSDFEKFVKMNEF